MKDDRPLIPLLILKKSLAWKWMVHVLHLQPKWTRFSGTQETLRKVETSYRFSQCASFAPEVKVGSDSPYAASKRSLDRYHQVLKSEGKREPVVQNGRLLFYRPEALPEVEESGEIQGIISRGDILACLVQDPPLSILA